MDSSSRPAAPAPGPAISASARTDLPDLGTRPRRDTGSTLVAVTGIPGTGKTRLTLALSDRLGAATSLERFEAASNPFLSRFYASPEASQRWALHTQLAFLTQAAAEVRRVRSGTGLTIADQALAVNAEVFAAGHAERGIMPAEEWQLYRDVWEGLKADPRVRPPELVVALVGPLPLILTRIAERGRGDEQKVDESYWAGLHSRFDRWLTAYADGPVMTLDVRDYDLEHEAEAAERIGREVITRLARRGEGASR